MASAIVEEEILGGRDGVDVIIEGLVGQALYEDAPRLPDVIGLDDEVVGDLLDGSAIRDDVIDDFGLEKLSFFNLRVLEDIGDVEALDGDALKVADDVVGKGHGDSILHLRAERGIDDILLRDLLWSGISDRLVVADGTLKE
jgi:hypothetical protein